MTTEWTLERLLEYDADLAKTRGKADVVDALHAAVGICARLHNVARVARLRNVAKVAQQVIGLAGEFCDCPTCERRPVHRLRKALSQLEPGDV